MLEELWTRHLFLYASAISFNLLLLSFPLTFILLSAASYSLQSEDVYHSASELIGTLLSFPANPGSKPHLFVERLASLLASFKVSTQLVGGSIFALVFLSYYLYLLLRTILNELWDLRDWDSIIHGTLRGLLSFGCLWGLLFSLLIVTLLVGLVVQKNLILVAGFHLGNIDHIAALVAPTALTITAFLLFWLVPAEGRPLHMVGLSSLTFGLAWELFRMLLVYSLIRTFDNLDAIYGSFAVLVTAATWLYYTSFSLVVSAVVGYSFNKARIATRGQQPRQ